jgi:hypothetical protein
MSPRAAWRLESYGYERVYDYAPGKADWLAFNLPHEGFARLAGDVLRHDVPTCGFRERLADVRDRLAASEFGMLVALNDEGIVMGRLDPTALDGDPMTTVDRVMREGPTTIRPERGARWHRLADAAGRHRRGAGDELGRPPAGDADVRGRRA